MSDHKARYLLESENQESYNRFADVTDPERLEAELALARALTESATNAGHHGLAASLLKVIGALSAATTTQRIRTGELLEKAALMRLAAQLVGLVTDTIRDRFDGWEIALEDLTHRLASTIDEAPKQLEAPDHG